MAELSQEEREEIESDIAWEKRQKKIFLICTLVCFVIGTVIGVVAAVESYEGASLIFAGVWGGVGIGGALSYFPVIPYSFKRSVKEQGFGEGIKTVLIGIAVWVVIFTLLGVLGFLIRLLVKNIKIKKLQKSLVAEAA